MPDDIDRILALIESLAATAGEQVKTIERLDARVRKLELDAAVAHAYANRWPITPEQAEKAERLVKAMELPGPIGHMHIP